MRTTNEEMNGRNGKAVPLNGEKGKTLPSQCDECLDLLCNHMTQVVRVPTFSGFMLSLGPCERKDCGCKGFVKR